MDTNNRITMDSLDVENCDLPDGWIGLNLNFVNYQWLARSSEVEFVEAHWDYAAGHIWNVTVCMKSGNKVSLSLSSPEYDGLLLSIVNRCNVQSRLWEESSNVKNK